MPGSKSLVTSLANLDRNVGFSPSAPTYEAIFTTAMADDTTATPGVECSYAGYARQPYNPIASAAVGGLATNANTATIVMPPVTGAPVTVVATALMSAITGGTVVYYDNTVNPQTVPVGQSYIFTIGQAVYTET